ncbi:unnamed protein product [Phytophthora lilii]|uniref:Unnamed protein product n=1 Tax=Phytophthora lilii TaxID=2077276 RepID=A0A9W7D928_9STRA|nr:unnamed protein product [Phytophthora lilii]
MNCLPSTCGDLPHVTQCIDAFLDVFSWRWNLEETFTKTGSLHLMQYVASKESQRNAIDPFYRTYLFNRVTWFAAQRGDLDTVWWLVEEYLPHEFLTKVVNGAAAGGHLDILQWLYENNYDRAEWGGIEMCRALTNGHSEVVEWLKNHAPPRSESLTKVMQAAGRAGNVNIIWWLYSDNDIDAEEALWSAQLELKWVSAKWNFRKLRVGRPQRLIGQRLLDLRN